MALGYSIMENYGIFQDREISFFFNLSNLKQTVMSCLVFFHIKYNIGDKMESLIIIKVNVFY